MTATLESVQLRPRQKPKSRAKVLLVPVLMKRKLYELQTPMVNLGLWSYLLFRMFKQL